MRYQNKYCEGFKHSKYYCKKNIIAGKLNEYCDSLRYLKYWSEQCVQQKFNIVKVFFVICKHSEEK